MITEPEVPQRLSVTFAQPRKIAQKLLSPDKGECQGKDLKAATVSREGFAKNWQVNGRKKKVKNADVNLEKNLLIFNNLYLVSTDL